MYRVYCKIGVYKYYWCHTHWVMWPEYAKSLNRAQARQIAEREGAEYERFKV